MALRETDTMAEWGVMREQAVMLVKSKFLPKSIETPEQALAIILTGRELGIGIMQALNNINVISGKPTVPPQLMLALINRTKELEDMSITDDGQACTVSMKRKGRAPHKESFSMKDAGMMRTTEYIGGEKKNIALSEKYNWKQQPAVMRKWRAVAACARVVFPDVIMGLYTPDEMGAAVEPESGEVIDVQVEPTRPEAPIWAGTAHHEDDEPEPVRPVKLEGAHPTSAPTSTATKHILAQIALLQWGNAKVCGWMEEKFNYAIESDDLAGVFDSFGVVEQRKIFAALKAEEKK